MTFDSCSSRHLRTCDCDLCSASAASFGQCPVEGRAVLGFGVVLAITAAENRSMSTFVGIQKMCEDVYTRHSLSGQKDDHQG